VSFSQLALRRAKAASGATHLVRTSLTVAKAASPGAGRIVGSPPVAHLEHPLSTMGGDYVPFFLISRDALLTDIRILEAEQRT